MGRLPHVRQHGVPGCWYLPRRFYPTPFPGSLCLYEEGKRHKVRHPNQGLGYKGLGT